MYGMEEARLERFQWFYRSEFPTVSRTLFLVHRDRGLAVAAAREAFVRAYRGWLRVERYDRPELWVRRAALRNASRASWRRRLRERDRALGPAPDKPDADPELWRAMGELSRPQRVAVTFFYFEDRPISDIAEITSSSEAAVKAHLERASRRLADRLGERVADVPG